MQFMEIDRIEFPEPINVLPGETLSIRFKETNVVVVELLDASGKRKWICAYSICTDT